MPATKSISPSSLMQGNARTHLMFYELLKRNSLQNNKKVCHLLNALSFKTRESLIHGTQKSIVCRISVLFVCAFCWQNW